MLACLRQELKDKGYEICIFSSKCKDIKDFLFDKVNIQKYWLGNSTNYYYESETETIFNLWHVSDSEKEVYAESVSKYFKRNLFKNKDLSAVKESILEIFL